MKLLTTILITLVFGFSPIVRGAVVFIPDNHAGEPGGPNNTRIYHGTFISDIREYGDQTIFAGSTGFQLVADWYNQTSSVGEFVTLSSAQVPDNTKDWTFKELVYAGVLPSLIRVRGLVYGNPGDNVGAALYYQDSNGDVGILGDGYFTLPVSAAQPCSLSPDNISLIHPPQRSPINGGIIGGMVLADLRVSCQTTSDITLSILGGGDLMTNHPEVTARLEIDGQRDQSSYTGVLNRNIGLSSQLIWTGAGEPPAGTLTASGVILLTVH